MRVYFLKFAKTDFTVTNGQWQSPVIDLYNNFSYTNYSVVKSLYGLQSTGTEWASNKQYTWIGLKQESTGSFNQYAFHSPTQRTYSSVTASFTDTGILSAGRYVDTSGVVNLIGFTLVTSGTYTGTPTVDIGLSPDNTAYSEFAWQYGFDLVSDTDMVDGADRYAQFNLNWDIDPGNDAVLYIRVEVGPPVIAPKYQITRSTLNRFPKWMAIREYGDEADPATPQLSTPNSLGGALINAVSGEWLEDLQARLQHDAYDLYLDTVDTSEIAWCYKSTSAPQYLYYLEGDGREIGRAWSMVEVFEAAATDDVAFWDENTQAVYCNRLYANLYLNGTLYKQQPTQVWNALDELGLLVDLPRLPLESNTSYQSRIYDVYKNPLGGMTGFQLALRRELNIWSLYGSTPDSAYLGATPAVLEMSDLETDSLYASPDGLPTSRFKKLVDSLAKQYPTTWGYFRWDNAMWDMGGPDNIGYAVLPNRFDATPLSDGQTQSGVGDGEDLLVYRPEAITGPHNFEAFLQVRGKEKVPQTQYPPVAVTVQVSGTGDRTFYNNPVEHVWFSVEMVPIQGATPNTHTYVASFELTSASDVDVNMATPTSASFGNKDIILPTGLLHPSLIWQDKITGAYLTQVPISNEIDTLTFKVGKWDVGTQLYIDLPGNIFDAWLSNNPGTLLTYNSGPLSVSNNLATPTMLPRLSLEMSSTQTNTFTGTWSSVPAIYQLRINDTDNITSQSPVTITVPTINWDPFILGNKKIKVQITSTNGATSPTYGGTIYNFDGSTAFVDSSYIYVNNLDAWSSGIQNLAGTTTSLTFSVGSGASYPTTGYIWEPYSSSTVIYSGTVDENGPWVGGIAPSLGPSNDFTFKLLSLGRSNFSIPQSTNYIINWVGVTTNDPQVVAWTDTNLIVPAVRDGSSTYPIGTITETLQGGSYIFSPFNLYVRLVPQPSAQWYPQLNSGAFFEDQQEYYFYATPSEETSTAASAVLNSVARQGAPIIVRTSDATPIYLRQVTFFDDSYDPSPATPTTLSLTHTEILDGNGTNILYASWPDLYGVTAYDVTTPGTSTPVSLVSNVATPYNQIKTTSNTVVGHQYQVSYVVNHSFYADNAYVGADGYQHTRLVFDAAPSAGKHYIIDYETETYNSATPVPLPLNPLYTRVDQGFIFISHDEYPLSTVVANINPSIVLANGKDYILLTLQSVDQYDNPKPNQTFSLSTTWGSLSQTSVTTNDDGYASLILTSTSTPPIGNNDPTTGLPRGTITITGAGGFNESIKFQVQSTSILPNQIYAVVANDQIPADLISKNVIYGKVLDAYFNPVPHANINWAKARTNFELFETTPPAHGTITADTNGTFTIGPFTSATPSGYWMFSVQSNSASPSTNYTQIGDIVFWYEYSPVTFGVDNLNGLPPAPVQMATPIGYIPPYAYGSFYPVNYDESVAAPTSPVQTPALPGSPPAVPAVPPPYPYPPPNVSPTGATPTINWLPPEWFPLPGYVQYQLGLGILGLHETTGDP